MSLLRLPPTRLGRFADSISFHLRRAHRAAQQQLATDIADTGLQPIHADLLTFIGDNPGTIPSVAAAALGRDRASITSTLRTLLDRGMIVRARTIRDRRSFLLTLTEAGAATRLRLQAHAAAHDALLDRVLGADKPALLQQLRRIAATLAEGDQDDDPGHDL